MSEITRRNGDQPPVIRDGFNRKLTKNREDLTNLLARGVVPRGKGVFGKALKQFKTAVENGQDWAVKLALEYGAGKPSEYVADVQATADGAPQFDPAEIEETVILKRRRRV